MARREFSAGGVVVRTRAGVTRIAAIRPQGKPPGTWALPKGLVDPGEDPAVTAMREVYEETGLRATVTAPLGSIRYTYTWEGEQVLKIVTFFLMRPLSGRIGILPPGMNVEVAEVGWIPMTQAVNGLAYPSEREVVVRARSFLAGKAL